jgi:ATP-grasp domain
MAGFRAAAEADGLVQSFAPGVPAFRTVSARKGRVIAGVSFAAERIHPEPTGASTVVRLVENREMDDVAAAMTAALGCSGFVSYDFMLDEDQGRAALIEMNPRCVGSCHLGGLFGHDICGALVAELSGSSAPRPHGLSTTKLVALFPKELERDPNSPYLRSSNVLHDVPRDDPALITAYLRRLTKLHPSRADAILEIVERSLAGPQSTIAAGGKDPRECTPMA